MLRDDEDVKHCEAVHGFFTDPVIFSLIICSYCSIFLLISHSYVYSPHVSPDPSFELQDHTFRLILPISHFIAMVI